MIRRGAGWLGHVPGKGWVPYVHPAKVADLEAEIARLRLEAPAAREWRCKTAGITYMSVEADCPCCVPAQLVPKNEEDTRDAA